MHAQFLISPVEGGGESDPVRIPHLLERSMGPVSLKMVMAIIF